MASFQTFGGLRTIRSNDRVMSSKPRGKMVKPILKRLSHSEKNSLDLDRGWDEQEEQFQYRSSPTWNSTWAPTKAAPTSGTSAGMGLGMMGSSGYTGSTVAIEVDEGRNSISGLRYHHTRTVSGTSHISVSSSGSGSGSGMGMAAPTSIPRSNGGSGAGGTFAHPFQQTPRTATPTLSYQNSLASSSLLDGSRDYSPTIAEDEDCNYNYNSGQPTDPASSAVPRDADPASSSTSVHTHLNNNNINNNKPVSPNARSQPILASPNPNRPSLSSQRTSSYSDNSPRQPALRITTITRTASTATAPVPSSRLANVASRSELHMSSSQDLPSPVASPTASQHNILVSPSSPRAPAPMSPISRSSFEAVNFRLRSKSELDTATRADHLREARRKFEARERLKEEKYAREEIKRRERAENKRAQALEKEAIACRKERDLARQRAETIALAEAMPLNSKHSRKISSNTSARPSLQRSPSSHLGRASLDPEKFASGSYDPEKFASGNYESMETSTPPAFGQQAGRGGSKGASFDAPRRAHTAAKRRTHGAWQAFILWLRTRLLKLSRDH